MKKILTLLACFVAAAAFADFSAYEDVVRIWAESDRLLALHFHDWRGDPPLEDLNKPDPPFSPENRFAYVELWDKKTGKKLWRRPSTRASRLQNDPRLARPILSLTLIVGERTANGTTEGNPPATLQHCATGAAGGVSEREPCSSHPPDVDGKRSN